jgi:hypothetical protein
LILCDGRKTSDNTAYTLRANALALRDIAPYGRNVVYAGNVIRNAVFEKTHGKNVEVIYMTKNK